MKINGENWKSWSRFSFIIRLEAAVLSRSGGEVDILRKVEHSASVAFPEPEIIEKGLTREIEAIEKFHQ